MKTWRYQGARDEDLKPVDRRCSTRRELGLGSALISLCWWVYVRGYLKLFHRLKINGRENLPAEPGFMLVSNHSSHLDTLALAAALPLRWNGHVFPVAAGDTFFNRPETAWFAAHFLNALPLWRRRTATHALADLRARLQAGAEVLILFPEGTRSRDGAMAPFKSGIGRLLAGTDVCVVPVKITGAFEAFPVDRKRPRPHPISLTIGAPISFPQLSDNHEGWNTIARELAAAVERL
ncbi:MAG: 1-acyl-sn-glycerol-3-phosphate acyltransferase [Candidatus Omnitrophota bacterium]|jgi:1-acyl-sn-glycerol-3-phosphate acyltransferase